MNEFAKLVKMMLDAHMFFTVTPLYDGYQIKLFRDNYCKKEVDDCIFHSTCHGYEEGLLETFCLNACEGYETAEQVFEGWKKMLKEQEQK